MCTHGYSGSEALVALVSCSFKQFGWAPGSILTGPPPRKVPRARSDGLCPDTARLGFFAGQEERWTRRGQSAAAHARVEGRSDGTWDASWGRGLERPERAPTTPGPRGPSRRHRGGQGLVKKSRPTGHERPSMARWTKSMRALFKNSMPASAGEARTAQCAQDPARRPAPDV